MSRWRESENYSDPTRGGKDDGAPPDQHRNNSSASHGARLSGRPTRSITPPVLSTFPGFVSPCLPTKAKHPPSGGLWLHEIKHDGFGVIAWKDGKRIKL
jgi:ATP-dependent DNA ligase